MVSTAGYTVSQLMLSVVLSYVIVFSLAIVLYMKGVLFEEEVSRRRLWVSGAVFVGGCVLLTIIFQFGVRIGTVNFLSGIVFGWFLVVLKDVLLDWQPWRGVQK